MIIPPESKPAQYLIRQTPFVVFRLQARHRGTVQFISDNVQILGYQQSQFLRKELSLPQLIHPEDFRQLRQKLIGLSRKNKRYQTEAKVRLRGADGQWHFLECKLWVEGGDRLEKGRLNGLFYDITDQHEMMDRALAAASFPDQNPNPILRVDFQGQILYLNESARRSFGGEIGEGQKIPDFLRPICDEAEASQNDLQTEIPYRGLHWLVNISVNPVQKYLNLYFTDITPLRRAEREISLNEAKLDSILNNLPALIWISDESKNCNYFNESWLRFTGRTLAEELGSGWSSGVHPEDLEGVLSGFSECFKKRLPFVMEYRLRRHDGEYRWIRDFGKPWIDADGKFLGYIGSCEDITQEILRQLSLKLKGQAIESSPLGIIISDRKGAIFYANPRIREMTGYNSEELIGKTPAVFKSGKQTQAFYEHLWKELLEGNTWTGELINRKKNGELYHERMTAAPVRGEDGEVTHFVALKEDISEQKKLQQMYLRSQRLESLGLLASGVAHDLNNVITPILLAVELMRSEKMSPEFTEFIDTIESSAVRGSGVVKQILAFARGGNPEKSLVDPRTLLKETTKVLVETFPKNIRVEMSIEPGASKILADPTQIHQVIMNLAVNARDAMPNGGALSFRLRHESVDESFVAVVPDAKPGDYLVFEVVDTGTGMSSEILDRIFDPFFTTKEQGKGTGLGLSTVLGILKSHGGFARVESLPGHGTTFRCYFPAHHEVSLPPSSSSTPLLRGAGEWILLVDDEANIREVTQKALEKNGYQVEVARDGAEGIALFAQKKDQWSLVLTDVMMPVMDGIALARAAKTIRPEIPILATSGVIHSDKIPSRPEDLSAIGFTRLLPKPYTMANVLKEVRECLMTVSKSS